MQQVPSNMLAHAYKSATACNNVILNTDLCFPRYSALTGAGTYSRQEGQAKE